MIYKIQVYSLAIRSDSLRLLNENPKEPAAILYIGRQEEKEENKASSLKDGIGWWGKRRNHSASETNRSLRAEFIWKEAEFLMT